MTREEYLRLIICKNKIKKPDSFENQAFKW